jgi:hypothetical protein
MYNARMSLGMGGTPMERGYERIYSTLLPRLAECDIVQNGTRLGGLPVSDGVKIRFLGRDYIITKEGVKPADGKPCDVNSRSLLIYYVTSSGAGDFLYDFALLNRLTGMIDGQNSLANGIMNGPIIREFRDDFGRFGRAVCSLGGTEIPAHGSGKHVWQLLPLPKILSRLVFYEADEEFPADIQIMFDRSAPRFLDFECLAFMTGAMIQEIIRAGRDDSGK